MLSNFGAYLYNGYPSSLSLFPLIVSQRQSELVHLHEGPIDLGYNLILSSMLPATQ